MRAKAEDVGHQTIELPPRLCRYIHGGEISPQNVKNYSKKMSTASPDLVQHFLNCPDAQQSDSILECLLRDHASPVIQRIVSSRVRRPASEDVQHDVLLDLITRLQYMKRSGGWNSIEDLSAYSAMAAFHGCRQHYRRCFPERYRLRARLRYLLARHPRFALWKTSAGVWVCGRREHSFESAMERSTSRKVSRVMESILEELARPLPFEDLLEQVGRHFSATHAVSQPTVTVETRLTHRDWIRKLWREIGQLPLPQRISLLLSMRDDDGNSGLILFPMVGIASLRQIAACMEMPARDLAGLWNCLPLDDQRIGAHLCLDRQRVINLRKSARERLGRRAKR
jgi:hypothetical protein